MAVNADMVRRRLIFDCMSDPQKASALSGLIGVSPEGHEVEEAASLQRLGAIAPLFPALSSISEWMAETAALLNVQEVDPDQVPPEFMEHFQTMFFTVIQGSLVAAISVLNDLGMITIEMEEDV